VKAVDLIHQGKFGRMVVLRGDKITGVPLDKTMKGLKGVDPELVKTAEVFCG
jgi:6-phosphofructokinase 1